MSDSSPVSVLLPQELRSRLELQAGKRALKLSTVIKVLVDERLRELEADEQLTRAEEWQRAQVWGTWERHQAGEVKESSWDEVERLFEKAGVGPSSTLSDRARTSPKTSRRKSRGS